MKRGFSISLHDFVLLKLAIVFSTVWFVGMLIAYFDLDGFFVNSKWGFLLVGIIVGVKPVWKMIFGARSAEGLPEKKGKKK